MHPLRHPRNAALVGIIFVVIGDRVLRRARRPRANGTLRHRAGTTMLIFLGVGDGDHGLRPRRRIDGRVTGRLRGRRAPS